MTLLLQAVVNGLEMGFLYALVHGAPGESFSLPGNAWHGWVVAILGAPSSRGPVPPCTPAGGGSNTVARA